MEGIISNYFTEIFNSSQPSWGLLERVCSSVTTRVPPNLVNFLSMRFTAEEVTVVLFQMSPSKAPGIDGFPTDFFQRFWEIVGEDVTTMCLGCLNDGQPMESINHTVI